VAYLKGRYGAIPLIGRASFRRKAGQRPPRSITLIVCEGETERAYFEAARLHHGLQPAEVGVPENTRGSAPISVVECAEQKATEAGGYDYIFCVFDRDSHQGFTRARDRIKVLAGRKAKPLPVREIISIPCLEVWQMELK
jgi:RloB-like protein